MIDLDAGPSGSTPRPGIRPSLAVLAASVILLAGATLSLTTGPIPVSVAEAWAVIGHRGLGLPMDQPADPRVVSVTWNLQFPRVALAALAGAGLAAAGVAAQVLVRNPLADPFILGVSSGAVLGTVVGIASGLGLSGTLAPGLAAALGALLALGLVTGIGGGSGATPLRLVLSGVAMGHLLAGLSGYVVLRHLDGGPATVQSFLAGNLENAALDRMWLPALVLVVALGVLAHDAARLNAVLVGEETAAALGVSVGRLRARLVVVIALLTGVMVAQAGLIGFVGLVVPHAVRLLVGSDHRRVVPVAAIGGAAFLVGCDWFAHALVAPQVLPIGLVCGGLGAPVFLWLVNRRGAERT